MEMKGGETQEQGGSFPLGLTGKLCEELLDSVVTWAVSYKQLITDEELLGLWMAVPGELFGRPPL